MITRLAFAQTTEQNSTSNTTRIFEDPSTGVSFEYPATWKRVARVHSYLIPKIISNVDPVPSDLAPGAIVELLAGDTAYAKTNFSSLDFVYSSLHRPSKTACDMLALQNDPGDTVQGVTSSRAQLEHLHTGDAGLCHQAMEDIYWTYRSGTCYLFEADLHILCTGANGWRDIRPTELNGLKRDLDKIVQTVRIRPPR